MKRAISFQTSKDTFTFQVIQSCSTLCNLMDYGIRQARILEWVAFPSPGDLPNLDILKDEKILDKWEKGEMIFREHKIVLNEIWAVYLIIFHQSVQSLSCVWLFVTPWTAACQASLSITNSQSPPIPKSIESVMPSNHLILLCPLLLLPPIPLSIRVFSNESALCIRWPKYWSFSFNISPSNEHPGLISFRMDWLDLHAFQGTLKSLLQCHSSKASILQHSAFFIVQLSHPYMTTGKTIALTRWTFVDKIMSLLLNMLSRLVITFLSRSKRLLISWLQSPSAVILEPIKIKSATVSTVSPSISHEVMGPEAMILVFWMLSFKPTFFTLCFHLLHQEAF